MTVPPAVVDPRGLFVLLCDGFVLSVVVLSAMPRSYDHSDAGFGQVVSMTPPLRPSYARCAAFLGVSLLVSALLIGFRSPDPTRAYHHLVAALMSSAVRDPATVDGYTKALLPVFQVNLVAFALALATVLDATIGRRVAIVVNAALFLIFSAVLDALLGVLIAVTAFPVGPAPLAELLIQYALAGVMLLRLVFTSFQLPRTTPVPMLRSADWASDLVLTVCLGVAAFLTAAGATYVASHFGSSPVVLAAIVFACPPYFVLAATLSLGAVRALTHQRADPSLERPPLDVIIPAFNEESVIAGLLRTLDDAAGRYGGPVEVVLCDDGSSDRTVAVARSAMDGFRYASGRIVPGNHSGKSAALNRALDHCSANYVFRVDADCEVHPDCFVYSMPYFLADPEIGLISALTLPKEPYRTWIDRMRLFELLVIFGFIRPAIDVVDGIMCVPGTFTGFRRGPALAVGGFVEGMYGEDVEFTYCMARLGYRAVIDTRIVSYEDVPNTQRQLRIQRTRWNRGGTMAFARHVPVFTGFTGPRFWFFATRQAVRRVLMPLRLSLLMYLVASAVLNPTVQLNLGRLGAVLVLRAVPAMVQTVGCALYYRRGRELLWLPLQYVFAFLKHFYALEALLSFNTRPVRPSAPVRLMDPLVASIPRGDPE